MSEITSRFISLYPTAVVRRNPIPDPEPGLTEDNLTSKARTHTYTLHMPTHLSLPPSRALCVCVLVRA